MEYIEITLGVIGAVVGARYLYLNIHIGSKSQNISYIEGEGNTVIQDGKKK